MFDLKNIDFIKTDQERGRNSYSFVGLKRNEHSERLEFWLPLGFDTFDTEEEYNVYGIKVNNGFDKVKNFFFKMYRTFQTYRVRKQNQLTEEEKTKDRDGVFEFENGFSFVNENKEQVIFYGKLNALDKILEGFDELRISSLEKKYIRSHEIDYSKIHKYLHQAIYLDDDVIYLDEMNIAKNVLIQNSPTIIQLFCFIYTEIKKELEETDSVSSKAFELAELFKDNCLLPESSLFSEENFAETINSLKNVFEDIDNKTTYKDEDYWHFYEAIEAFLMGERLEDENGIFFGISNFYDIWEDMCQSYMLSPINDFLKQVLFADVKGKLASRRDLGLDHNLEVNPFRMEINTGFAPRFLKPDLVLGSLKYETSENIYQIKPIRQGLKIVFNDFVKIQNFHRPILDIYNRYGNIIPNPLREGKTMKVFTEQEVSLFKDSVKNYLNKHKVLINMDLSSIQIIDYKYMRQSDYERYNSNVINEKGENKIKEDIHKQLIYEWTVQNNFENSETKSEFWIPYYSDNLDFDQSRLDITEFASTEFKLSQIKVVKINFKTLQENYVKFSNSL